MKIKLNYPERTKYLIDVTLEVEGSTPFFLQLASWRPGRYELANFAQYLYPLSSEMAEVKKVTKDKWEVIPSGNTVELKYQFYANQPDAGGSLLTEEFIYLNPINFIPKLEGYNGGYELELNCPDNYTVATSLIKESNKVISSSYEELVDSPIIASSTIQCESYKVGASTFYVWIQGNIKPNWETIIPRFKAFSEEQVNLFGGFPSKEYHFLNVIHPFQHYHGVEHLNSTVIVLGPDTAFSSEKMTADFLGISCHELFHYWNIKRIKPQELVNLDLSQEAYFNTGLLAEGLTTYYGDYLLARSGVFSQEEYFKELDIYLQRHFHNFGRFNNSIAESSVDLWLDGYKLGIPNRKVSIYIKGALISLIFDLEIRAASDNKFSLDDVMRKLWSLYGKSDCGYSIESYREIILGFLSNGSSLFDELVFGKNSILPYLKEALKTIGCDIEVSENENQLLSKFGFFVNPNDNKVYKVDPSASQNLVETDTILLINGKPFDKAQKEYADEIEVVFDRYGKKVTCQLEKTEQHYFANHRIVQKVKEGQAFNNFLNWINTRG